MNCYSNAKQRNIVLYNKYGCIWKSEASVKGSILFSRLLARIRLYGYMRTSK